MTANVTVSYDVPVTVGSTVRDEASVTGDVSWLSVPLTNFTDVAVVQ